MASRPYLLMNCLRFFHQPCYTQFSQKLRSLLDGLSPPKNDDVESITLPLTQAVDLSEPLVSPATQCAHLPQPVDCTVVLASIFKSVSLLERECATHLQ